MEHKRRVTTRDRRRRFPALAWGAALLFAFPASGQAGGTEDDPVIGTVEGWLLRASDLIRPGRKMLQESAAAGDARAFRTAARSSRAATQHKRRHDR